MHFLEQKFMILVTILLTFLPKGLINNIPELDQKMAWRRPGDKPLCEPMMVIYIYMPLGLNELTRSHRTLRR